MFSPDDRVNSPGRVFTVLIINLLFLFSLVRTRRRAAGESWTTKIETRVCDVCVWSGIARRAKREKRDARHCPRPRRSRKHEAFIVVVVDDGDEKRDLQKWKLKTHAAADVKNQLRSTLITRRRRRRRRRRMTMMSTMIIVMQILLLINRAAPMGGRRSYKCIFCFKRDFGGIGNDITVTRYRTTKLIEDHL